MEGTVIKIGQRKFFVNDRNALEGLTDLFRSALIYKGVEIHFSIEALAKLVRAPNIKVSLFHCALMSSP